MARGIFCCHGCEVDVDGGGIGCCACSSKLSIFNSPPTRSAAPLSSTDYDQQSHSAKREVGDVLYGRDDSDDMKDYRHKDDVLESMRMERALKYARRKKKKWGAFTQCLEFLKLTWCLRF